MENRLNFTLTQEMIEKLNIYGEILKKDSSTMLEEALTQYFETQEKILLEEDIRKESAMTNLNYNEFWDGVDL